MTERRIRPAVEQDQAMSFSKPIRISISPAVEHDEAMPITASLAGAAVMKASATVTGPGQPQAETLGEGVGVLGLALWGTGIGYSTGQSIAELPGGLAGAALGGAAACATLRWPPTRRQPANSSVGSASSERQRWEAARDRSSSSRPEPGR